MTDPHEQSSRPHQHDLECLELCPICRAADVLRASGATELNLDELGREALVTLRAVIDGYLERSEPRSGESRVEQIPID